jgi:hypothetical protein
MDLLKVIINGHLLSFEVRLYESKRMLSAGKSGWLWGHNSSVCQSSRYTGFHDYLTDSCFGASSSATQSQGLVQQEHLSQSEELALDFDYHIRD